MEFVPRSKAKRSGACKGNTPYYLHQRFCISQKNTCANAKLKLRVEFSSRDRGVVPSVTRDTIPRNQRRAPVRLFLSHSGEQDACHIGIAAGRAVKSLFGNRCDDEAASLKDESFGDAPLSSANQMPMATNYQELAEGSPFPHPQSVEAPISLPCSLSHLWRRNALCVHRLIWRSLVVTYKLDKSGVIKAEYYARERSVPCLRRIRIAKLQFIVAELQKVQRLETKRQGKQAPPEETR